MNAATSLLKGLKNDFWGTLAGLQSRRGIWLFFAGTALFMELFSWAFFQTFLGLEPCELCVYIRFSMLAICLGALVAAVLPDSALFRLAGYALTAWWTVQGFLWSKRLDHENFMAADPDWISGCAGIPSFPFGLPLHEWLPSHFMPLAICGEDSAWTLFGFSMPEWLFLVYGCFALAILLMLVAWIRQAFFIRRV